MADRISLAAAALVLGLALGGFYYYSDEPLLFRVLGILVGAGIAMAIALRTERGMSVRDFGREALIELRKVVWPTRKETTQTTLVVLVMVILIGILLWLFDMFLLWAVRLLTGQGG